MKVVGRIETKLFSSSKRLKTHDQETRHIHQASRSRQVGSKMCPKHRQQQTRLTIDKNQIADFLTNRASVSVASESFWPLEDTPHQLPGHVLPPKIIPH